MSEGTKAVVRTTEVLGKAIMTPMIFAIRGAIGAMRGFWDGVIDAVDDVTELINTDFTEEVEKTICLDVKAQ